jgi:beta-galactosidase
MMASLLEAICIQSGAAPILYSVPQGVEVTKRSNENGSFLFLLNHTGVEQSIEIGQASVDLISSEAFTGAVAVGAGEVRVLHLP